MQVSALARISTVTRDAFFTCEMRSRTTETNMNMDGTNELRVSLMFVMLQCF